MVSGSVVTTTVMNVVKEVFEENIPGKKVEGICERRTNREFKELYSLPNIEGTIKRQRLRWLSHIMRMQGQRIPRRVMKRVAGAKKARMAEIELTLQGTSRE